MTREEQLDWLCRLRSEVKIYMPIEWVDHFEDALTESINTLSQEPKSGKWIPFSERLPKPFENCLITTTDGEVIYHYDDGHYSKYKAWMPLPEPYKAESEE